MMRSGPVRVLPAIAVDRPAFGGFLGQPGVVAGSAITSEGAFQYVIADAEGLIIADGFATAACGSGCRGDFGFTVHYRSSGHRWGR